MGSCHAGWTANASETALRVRWYADCRAVARNRTGQRTRRRRPQSGEPRLLGFASLTPTYPAAPPKAERCSVAGFSVCLCCSLLMSNPLGSAEHRSARRGRRPGMAAERRRGRSRVGAVPRAREKRREPCEAGRVRGACFLLATFLCTSKEKYARPTGRNTPIQNPTALRVARARSGSCGVARAFAVSAGASGRA
jgi:hypothetical protein